jgi:hypothetical protein
MNLVHVPFSMLVKHQFLRSESLGSYDTEIGTPEVGRPHPNTDN